MKEYIVFDFETTGTDPLKDVVTQIAAIHIKDGKQIGSYNKYIKIDREVPEKITAITGITNKFLNEKGISERAAWVGFSIFIGKNKLLGHNCINFDRLFLNFFFNKYGLDMPHHDQYYDTAVVYKARKLNIVRGSGETFYDAAIRVMSIRAYGVKFNLSLACKELKIDVSHLEAHRADADVQMTNLLYQFLLAEKIKLNNIKK